ncbi:hypothetical protein M407DRAFT_29158, partial [Tulasnella calospora MUT 4182]
MEQYSRIAVVRAAFFPDFRLWDFAHHLHQSPRIYPSVSKAYDYLHMAEWKEVRDSNAAMLTDSEDGWTEAIASPRSGIRSPFSEAATDSYVDVGVTGHSSPERSVSPFSLVSTESERFVPENGQELAAEESSQDGSAHGDNPFEDDNIPEDDDDDDDIPEDDDMGDIEDWDTQSIHTINA